MNQQLKLQWAEKHNIQVRLCFSHDRGCTATGESSTAGDEKTQLPRLSAHPAGLPHSGVA